MLNAFVKLKSRHPYLTNMFAAGLAWGCGDFLCQQTEFHVQGLPMLMDVDFKRMRVAAIYGAFIMTPLATLWYEGSLKGGLLFLNKLKYFKPRIAYWKKYQPMKAAMLQSGITFLCVAPILATSNIFFNEYFYHNHDMPMIIENIKKKLLPILGVDICYWPMVDFLTFSFVSKNFRVPFILVADIIWSFLLSAINHNLGSAEVVYELQKHTSARIQELTAVSKHFKCFCEEDDTLTSTLFRNFKSTNHVMNEIITMFGSNDAKLHALVFNAIDVEKKGYLEMKEVRIVFRILNSSYEEERIRGIFQLFDLNGDGRISFEEFCTFMKHVNCLEPEDCRALFSNFIFVGFDIEKNHQIEKKELKIIFEMLGFGDDVDVFMNDLDIVGDGIISKWEFNEFMSKKFSIIQTEV